MKLSLGVNLSSLRAQRNLASASEELGAVYTRLTSGMRINSASDDAAGLAISESLDNDQRVFGQGIRNLNDGISLLSIADGALEQLSNITVRLQELAEQGANGSLGNAQREALDAEAQELANEYFRIARTTEFNGLNLFDGSLEELHLQAGYGADGGVTSTLGGAVGDGTFQVRADMFISSDTVRAMEIQTADLDGDGNLDIVGAGREGTLGQWMAFVQMGNGDGTFDPETTYEVAPGVAGIRLGDINNDGNLDIITSGAGVTDEDVSYRFGNGDGTFGDLTTIGVLSANPIAPLYGVELGDFNGDGNLDIITGEQYGNTFVLTGDGAGGFVESNPIPSLGGSVNPQYGIADLNNDGFDDVVAAYENAGGNTAIDVYYSDGSGGFDYQETKGVGSGGAHSFTSPPELVDINNDGALDVILNDGVNYDLHIVYNNGDGTFGDVDSFGALYASFVVEDFNGDGNMDIAGEGLTTIDINLGDGEGNFTLDSSITHSFSLIGVGAGPAAADINNDGVIDLVASDGNTAGAGGDIEIYTGNTVSGVSPLDDFDLGTQAGAKQALPLFQKALTNLGLQRGQIGGFQSRLDSSLAVLSTTNENLATAESRIRDADVAQEAANLVRQSIIRDAAASIVSSANQQYEVALGLLSDS